MAQERRDPVPPGTYSIFLNEDEFGRWQDWLASHRATVQQLATIEKRVVASKIPIFSVDTDFEVIWKTVGSNNFFRVLAPTPWVGLGFPTIENRPISAWAKEENENPEYVPDKTPLDDVKDIVMLGAGIYLGGVLLMRAMR